MKVVTEIILENGVVVGHSSDTPTTSFWIWISKNKLQFLQMDCREHTNYLLLSGGGYKKYFKVE